jgi:flavodoxin
MKVVVVYDSIFGNTAQIARAVTDSLRPTGDVVISRVNDASTEQLKDAQLIVVGSHTRGFRPTQPLQKYLDSIPEDSLNGVRAASFDTRISLGDIKNVILRFLVKLGGWAAMRITVTLQKKGGNLIVPPEGFIVKGVNGPLAEGELERAAGWAKTLV